MILKSGVLRFVFPVRQAPRHGHVQTVFLQARTDTHAALVGKQDDDVLMTYDADVAHVATDPDDPVGQWLHVGDLRPQAWFATFGNLRPRPAGTTFPPAVLAALSSAPALRFTTTEPGTDGPIAGSPLPPGLADRFELLVGLAQRRFFDRPCAIAMARTLQDLLVAFLDAPDLHPGRVWMLGDRATVGRDILIVDQQFSIDGQTHRWRLNSDLSDGDARRWVLGMLSDCAAKVVTAYATHDPSLLLDMSSTTPPRVDPHLPATLSQRAVTLATRTTLAGLLAHRRAHLGLTVTQVAQAAVLPATVVAGWEAGGQAPPSQVQRCAPVLQLPEQVLLAAAGGVRDSGFWPLPTSSTRTEHRD